MNQPSQPSGNGKGNREEKVIGLLQQSSSPHIRLYCLKLLGREGGGETVRQALISALQHDESPVVRHEAAFWLGELGDREATAALAHASQRDPAPLVRHESLEALGWIPTEESRAALETALHDPDETVRKTAAISLAIHREPRDRWEASLGQQ